MKRKDNQQHISDLIQAYVKKYRLQDQLTAVDIQQAWSSIVGDVVARHTQEVKLRKQVLVVRLDSAPLRQELNYGRQQLIDRINEHFGRRLIDDVLLV